jgi:hypothetical protein
VLGVFKGFVIVLDASKVNADMSGAVEVNVVMLVLVDVTVNVVKECCVFYCYAECLLA